MDFSICFLAGGQMFPGTLAVPCAAIAAASPTTPVATRAKASAGLAIHAFCMQFWRGVTIMLTTTGRVGAPRRSC